MAENDNNALETGASHSTEPSSGTASETAKASSVLPDWAPNMMLYSDISRMLFRMHRNVIVHMDAQKRLTARMQAVFAHEQAMVLELARLIDESMAAVTRKSNESRPAPSPESLGRVFDHATRVMQETGRMMTDIQLESLALLQHYVEESTSGATQPNDVAKPDAPEETKGTSKE